MTSLSDTALFDLRWDRAKDDLLAPLSRLYGDSLDPARLRILLSQKWTDRPDDLKRLDLERDLTPRWFQHQRMAGYVFYIDRFSETLKALPDRIPYLTDLGITYAHFMPCLKPRPGDSDGGYAVMDYGAIDPKLGDMDDFRKATRALRQARMSTCIDMVLNHTAYEHDWAVRARAGDPFYQAFYRLYDTDTIPQTFERTLLEIFPDQAPGNFTFDPDLQKWVWTTFNRFQWDLNWENPEVFLAIMGIILDLANAGAEVLRLDAVAFMWKRLGTLCQNEPEVHDILQAINQAASIAAPATIFKAEAIVGPHQLVPYLGTGRHAGRVCNLAYHNSLMVQFWSALASQDTAMMRDVLDRHFPDAFRDAQWATYIRCHDDIGWAITEEDADRHHISGPGHRAFLADFYAGRFDGSFARGADFQVNEVTGDKRTNGSFASLAGLEAALERNDRGAIQMAIDRILLGHALILSFAGMPLIYMGDELGLLSDTSYLADPAKASDGRWMQRPVMDWDKAATAPDADAAHGHIYRGTRHLLACRAAIPECRGDVPTRILHTDHNALFCFRRPGQAATLTALFNFTDKWQQIEPERVGFSPDVIPADVISGALPRMEGPRIVLPPYGRLWLRDAGQRG